MIKNKNKKHIFAIVVFLLLVVTSCSNTISKEDKELEDKFMYIAKLYIDEQKKEIDGVKFIMQNNVWIYNPNECNRYLPPFNSAVNDEFYIRPYPKHLSGFRDSVIALKNYSITASLTIFLACTRQEIFEMTGNGTDAEISYNYTQEAKDYLHKADAELIYLEEYLNNKR